MAQLPGRCSFSSRTPLGRCPDTSPEPVLWPQWGLRVPQGMGSSGQHVADEGSLNASCTTGKYRGLSNSWRCGHTLSLCTNLCEGPASAQATPWLLGSGWATQRHVHYLQPCTGAPSTRWHTLPGSRELGTTEPKAEGCLLWWTHTSVCRMSLQLQLWARSFLGEVLFWSRAELLWCGMESAK